MTSTIERPTASEPEKPEHKKSRFTKRQKIGAGLVAGATILTAGGVVAATAAFGSSQGSEPKPVKSSSAETQHLTVSEKLAALIKARPEVTSTSDYMKQFEGIRIPFVKGQPASDVVAEYQQSVWKLVALEFSDIKNMSYDDQTQWALENHTAEHPYTTREETVNGIVDELNLDYYTTGVKSVLYGPDGSTAFAQESLPLVQAGIKRDIVDFLLLKDTPDPSSIHIIDAGVLPNSTDTDIYATLTAYSTDGGGTEQNPNMTDTVHLRAEETADNQTSWYVVNNAHDTGFN